VNWAFKVLGGTSLLMNCTEQSAITTVKPALVAKNGTTPFGMDGRV